MKNHGKLVCLSATLLLFVATGAADPITLTLTGVGDSVTLGDVYVDPYTATVGTANNIAIICDDWSNNTYFNESWQANAIPLSLAGNASDGTPLFGNNQALYNEVAWLADQLRANSTNPTKQTELSFAIWQLTYGAGGTYEESPSPFVYLSDNLSGGTSNAIYQSAQNYLTEAEGESTYSSDDWEILTPIPGTSVPLSDGTPQEFLVDSPVPEPSGVVLLGSAVLGLALFSRRRFRQPLRESAASLEDEFTRHL
jgi:hypothetical protein